MNKKRTVFLFGAGAVIDWGGPQTLCDREELTILPERGSGEIKNRICCLTHLIINIGFKCKDGSYISNRIYEILKENSFEKKEINFESIINVVEELSSYYSNSNRKLESNIIGSFLKPSDVMENILNYEIVGGEAKHGYKLHIPDFPHLDHPSINYEAPEQFFLQQLISNLLDGIVGHISKYSYYTNQITNVIESPLNHELNNSFFKWVMKILGSNGILRMYTLNYDRLFKVILENRGIRIFEGFECETSANPGDKILPDIPRILSDFNSSIYYNLHGSAYWGVTTRNRNSLPTSQFHLSGVPRFSSNLWEPPLRQMDKGKTVMLTNMITGYQKTSKTSVTPFKQFLAAFDRDCICADKLVIVGYGFGDEHINESIITALIHNPEIEIIIIDPNFITNNFDAKLNIEIFSHSHFNLNPTKISENLFSYLEGKVKVYTHYFRDIFGLTD